MPQEAVIDVVPDLLDELDRLVDTSDDIGARTGQPDGFRNEMIQFRLRVHNAFDGGSRMATRTAIAELAAVADEVRWEIYDWLEGLERAREVLDRFVESVPEDHSLVGDEDVPDRRRRS